MWQRSIGVALVTAVLTLANPGGAAAQTTDVVGTWNLAVDVMGTVTNPSVTLAQNGDGTLTGSIDLAGWPLGG